MMLSSSALPVQETVTLNSKANWIFPSKILCPVGNLKNIYTIGQIKQNAALTAELTVAGDYFLKSIVDGVDIRLTVGLIRADREDGSVTLHTAQTSSVSTSVMTTESNADRNLGAVPQSSLGVSTHWHSWSVVLVFAKLLRISF